MRKRVAKRVIDRYGTVRCRVSTWRRAVRRDNKRIRRMFRDFAWDTTSNLPVTIRFEEASTNCTSDDG